MATMLIRLGTTALGEARAWRRKTQIEEASSSHTDAEFKRTVSRPLCAYPKHAQYNGAGPRDDAVSFTRKE